MKIGEVSAALPGWTCDYAPSSLMETSHFRTLDFFSPDGSEMIRATFYDWTLITWGEPNPQQPEC